MRPLAFILLLAFAAPAAEPPSAPSWPMWDGRETVEQYAKRTKLELTKTLDLGNGVKLEMVLIPAGKFTMGTPEPEAVDEEGLQNKIATGVIVFGVGAGALLILLSLVVTRAIRLRQRPQYSLARFMAMIVLAGVGVLGGMHWRESTRLLAEARAEYFGALARYNEAEDTEKPAHEVTLTKPFYMGKFEVTQGQYQHVTGTDLKRFKGRDLPAGSVSWDMAQAFCKEARERTGAVVRLPTDAEWEYACRAGTKTVYYTGDSEADLDRAGWYGNNSKGTTHPVGQKVPNACGVYDMHGSVCEWVQDIYERYKSEPAVDPQGASQGQARVLRNGCSGYPPRECRSATRSGIGPGSRHSGIGFRVSADVPPKAP